MSVLGLEHFWFGSEKSGWALVPKNSWAAAPQSCRGPRAGDGVGWYPTAPTFPEPPLKPVTTLALAKRWLYPGAQLVPDRGTCLCKTPFRR